VTFTMGLAKPDIPFEYFTIETLQELKGGRDILAGQSLFSFCCSACHGKEGEGKDYRQYETGVPSIGYTGLLQVVSFQFIRFTLLNGRGTRQMASWHPEYSGLFNGEIDSVANFLMGNREVYSSWDKVQVINGSGSSGREIFMANCQVCHGPDGKDGIVIPLNNPGFLEIAPDRFIYLTLLSGRGNTAMPSWSYFTDSQMADLLAFIRSWGHMGRIKKFPGLEGGNPQDGALQYHYLCSRCHGEFGEGETGPAILNKDFLEAAGNNYLYHTIGYGRSHTAMFGWKGQTAGDTRIEDDQIVNIIAYMKSTQQLDWDYIYAGSNPGNATTGGQVFRKHCAECHGAEGQGTWAPALNNQDFLSAATNGFILATITIGRAGTEMPPWGRGEQDHPALSGKERQDLVAFVRSWQKIRIKY
jgi:cbb3-type cytochrome c oxidase subunit III